MDGLRSNSCGNGRMQLPDGYYHGGGEVGRGGRPANSNSLHDLRCYSASYATSTTAATTGPPPNYYHQPPIHLPKDLKKGSKSTNGSISKANWFLSDPEMQRKRRVASYKVYAVEGKMKGSFRKSFRWVKDRISQIVDGWR